MSVYVDDWKILINNTDMKFLSIYFYRYFFNYISPAARLIITIILSSNKQAKNP